MKKVYILGAIISFLFSATSCKNEKSLQAYLVKSQEEKGFITLDVPTSFLQLKSEDVSEDVIKTLESIRKINVVALPYQTNEDAYETEKETLRAIFTSDSYKDLMSIKRKGMTMKVYYTGNPDAIDEVIVFGYGKEQGVGVARLLGDNMNPGKIIKMMNQVSMDSKSLNLGKFKAIFKNK
jgi:hypothetical protein